MKSINANEATSQFKSLLETVQNEPIEIKKIWKTGCNNGLNERIPKPSS